MHLNTKQTPYKTLQQPQFLFGKISCFFLHKNVNLFALQRKTFCRIKGNLFALLHTKILQIKRSNAISLCFGKYLVFCIKTSTCLHCNAKLFTEETVTCFASKYKTNIRTKLCNAISLCLGKYLVFLHKNVNLFALLHTKKHRTQ